MLAANTISKNLDTILNEIEAHPDALKSTDFDTMEAFLHSRLAETSKKARLLIEGDVRGAATFAFGMSVGADAAIAAPQSVPVAPPSFSAAIAPAFAPRLPQSILAPLSAPRPKSEPEMVPIGRAAGTGETIYGPKEEPVSAPAPTKTDDNEPLDGDFISE